VAEAPVVNASPLIFLSRGNLLHLLRLLAETAVVPAVVAEEIARRGAEDVTARALRDNAWLQVRDTPAIPDSLRVWDLGEGESAVSWALAHPRAEAIVDDLAARRCAATLQIPVRGTLGLVLLAKRRGVIPSARNVLNQLRDSGMYLSDRVLNEALALVGE